jgi:hypothetical protein
MAAGASSRPWVLPLILSLYMVPAWACPERLFDPSAVTVVCQSNTPENCCPGVGCVERDIQETWALHAPGGLHIDIPACPQQHLARAGALGEARDVGEGAVVGVWLTGAPLLRGGIDSLEGSRQALEGVLGLLGGFGKEGEAACRGWLPGDVYRRGVARARDAR